jgi:NDP-sugar pyrophosphorylase family protein
MHAVIMAGGRGSRLRPYTTVLPKPLMPLGDRPILDVLLHQLSKAGVDGVTISVGHLGGLIESWVLHEASYGMPIAFVYEEEPLGTAGALANMRQPNETFLALNGDVLTTLDFARLARINRERGAIATMAIKQRHVDIEYGVVHCDPEGRIDRLEEKPRLEFTVSMGVYAMEPEIIDLIGPRERIDFPDLLLRAKDAGHDVHTLLHDGYWRDIGNRDDYEAAIDDFDADPDTFLTGSTRSRRRRARRT